MKLLFSSLVVISTLCSALLLATQVQAEQIYQWKDDRGRVHYSQRPPRNQKAEKVNIKSPRFINQNLNSDNNQVNQKADDADGKLASKKKEYDKNCQQATRLLSQIESNPVDSVFNLPNGESRKLTAKERELKIKQANASMDYYCQSR